LAQTKRIGFSAGGFLLEDWPPRRDLVAPCVVVSGSGSYQPWARVNFRALSRQSTTDLQSGASKRLASSSIYAVERGDTGRPSREEEHLLQPHQTLPRGVAKNVAKFSRGWSNFPVLVPTIGQAVVCPLDMERVVAYLRVSTQRQRRSGLGIDAQRTAIQRFADSESLAIIAEFVEVETGKGIHALERRPNLAAALSAAKTAKCSVVVAKLDRLSPAMSPSSPA